MPSGETNDETAAVLALGALGWILATPERARRLLDITGIDPDSLRAGLDDPAVMAATLTFLEAHEPDMIACADAIGTTPSRLADARRVLEAG